MTPLFASIIFWTDISNSVERSVFAVPLRGEAVMLPPPVDALGKCRDGKISKPFGPAPSLFAVIKIDPSQMEQARRRQVQNSLRNAPLPAGRQRDKASSNPAQRARGFSAYGDCRGRRNGGDCRGGRRMAAAQAKRRAGQADRRAADKPTHIIGRVNHGHPDKTRAKVPRLRNDHLQTHSG